MQNTEFYDLFLKESFYLFITQPETKETPSCIHLLMNPS